MMDDLKFTKAALLFDQSSAYSVGLKDEFAKALKGMGGEIVSEQAYTKGAADFNAQLTRIREGKAVLWGQLRSQRRQGPSMYAFGVTQEGV